jgi:hypothetical protein
MEWYTLAEQKVKTITVKQRPCAQIKVFIYGRHRGSPCIVSCINESSIRHCKNFRTRPDWLWGPPSLLYSGYRVSVLGIKRPGHGFYNPPSSMAEVNGEIRRAMPLAPLWDFMACYTEDFSFICHCFFQVLREILGPETRWAITFMIRSHFYVVYFTALSVTQALLTCVNCIGSLKFGCYCLRYVPASKPSDHAWFEVLEAITLYNTWSDNR